MSGHQFVPFTKFGKTKLVPLITFTNGERDAVPKTAWDDCLWVERGEDWYALMSEPYRSKTVLVVERAEWLKASEYE